jgi:hypothetical protein
VTPLVNPVPVADSERLGSIVLNLGAVNLRLPLANEHPILEVGYMSNGCLPPSGRVTNESQTSLLEIEVRRMLHDEPSGGGGGLAHGTSGRPTA